MMAFAIHSIFGGLFAHCIGRFLLKKRRCSLHNSNFTIMAEPPSRVSAGGADVRAAMNYPLVKVSNSATSNSISTLHMLLWRAWFDNCAIIAAFRYAGRNET
jgi:hypothetical protein